MTHITIEKEKLESVLEALEANQPINYCLNNNGERFPMMQEDPFKFERNTKAITIIKEALAQPKEPEREPVAWSDYESNGIHHKPVAWMDSDGNVSDNNDYKCFPIPLYTTSAQPKDPEQAPVAWVDPKHLEWLAQSPDNMTGAGLAARQRSTDMVSLYTTPPQRKPLTREVIDRDFYGRVDFVRQVEAAHNIKE